VLVTVRKNVIGFEIPINYPDIHKLSIENLLSIHRVAVEGGIAVTHKPNNKIAFPSGKKSNKDCA